VIPVSLTIRRITAYRELTKREPVIGPIRRMVGPGEHDMPESIALELQSAALIESLRRPDLAYEERRKLIFQAEVLPFWGQEAAVLASLLKQFIDDCRDSNVPADLVAVGSAIRKFLATAPTNEALDAAANLLKADGCLPRPIELEIDITRMVVRKLTSYPPGRAGQYSALARRLEELVDDYARPRFLARENHGAVALNAILGLVLTRSGRDFVLLERVRHLGVPWFQRLLGRSAPVLLADLIARHPDASIAAVARTLAQLSELGSPVLAS
jgi:hypothetical protein